jgi:hypothetical protein
MPYFQKEPQSGEYTFFLETHKEQLAPQFENIDKEAREAASRYLSEAGAHFFPNEMIQPGQRKRHRSYYFFYFTISSFQLLKYF